MSTPDTPRPAPAGRPDLVEGLCDDMQAQWAAGRPVGVEPYLLRHPELAADDEAVLDLLLLEVALREEAGTAPSLEELAWRFPNLGEQLRRHLQVQGLFRRPPAVEAAERPGEPERDPARRVADYQLGREIGHGAMGTVYEAWDTRLRRRVALKMLADVLPGGGHDLERFATEARAVARLRDPHIVEIYDVGTHQGRPFIAFELLEGGSLADRLGGGPLPVPVALSLMATLAWTLEVVHRHGIVHRDLKPANVLFHAADGEPGTPKIVDFGLAKLSDASARLTRTGDLLGTPAYAAPEQASGASAAGPAADVYSLGAILYETLTGRPPFRAASTVETIWQVVNVDPPPPCRLRPDLPRELQTICLKCLEKDPARRYATAGDLARDLERHLRNEPIRARPLSSLALAARWARRRPVTAGLLAALGATVLVAAVGIATGWAEARRAAGSEAEARRRAEVSLYRSRVSQAALLWESSDLAGARAALDLCAPAPARPDLRGWEWNYLARLCRHGRPALAHRYWVQAVAVSPDGRELAAGTGTPNKLGPGPGELVVWRLPDAADAADAGRLLWRRGTDEVRAVAYSPDGRWLAWGTTAPSVHVVERATGREVHAWRPGGPVLALCFHPRGARLAAAHATPGGGVVTVHDLATGDPVASVRVESGGEWMTQRLAWAPGGRWLAFSHTRDGLRLWDPQSDEQKSLPSPGDWRVSGLAFVDDRRLASAGLDGAAVWGLAAGRPGVRLAGHSGLVGALAVGPDGRTLATAGADRTVRLWEADTGRQTRLFRGHTQAVRCVAFSPDGRHVFSGGQDGQVVRWDPRRLSRGVLIPAGLRTNAMTFTPSGEVRAVRMSGLVQTWTAAGAPRGELTVGLRKNPEYPRCLADFLEGGESVASASRDDARVLAVWDASTGAEKRSLRGHTMPINCVSPAADGRRVLTAAWHPDRANTGSEVKLWDAVEGALLADFAVPGVQAVSLALSPDGTRVAVGERAFPPAPGGRECGVSVWTLAGRCLYRVGGHDKLVPGVAFSPDGRQLASADFGNEQVWLVDAADGRVLARAPGPHSPTFLRYSPDGRRVAVIGYHGAVHLIDPADGQEVFRLPGLVGTRDDDPANDTRIAFSPDGSYLLSTNWDGSVNVWDGRPLPAGGAPE